MVWGPEGSENPVWKLSHFLDLLSVQLVQVHATGGEGKHCSFKLLHIVKPNQLALSNSRIFVGERRVANFCQLGGVHLRLLLPKNVQMLLGGVDEEEVAELVEADGFYGFVKFTIKGVRIKSWSYKVEEN